MQVVSYYIALNIIKFSILRYMYDITNTAIIRFSTPQKCILRLNIILCNNNQLNTFDPKTSNDTPTQHYSLIFRQHVKG